jgi:hypothetical protein
LNISKKLPSRGNSLPNSMAGSSGIYVSSVTFL